MRIFKLLDWKLELFPFDAVELSPYEPGRRKEFYPRLIISIPRGIGELACERRVAFSRRLLNEDWLPASVQSPVFAPNSRRILLSINRLGVIETPLVILEGYGEVALLAFPCTFASISPLVLLRLRLFRSALLPRLPKLGPVKLTSDPGLRVYCILKAEIFNLFVRLRCWLLRDDVIIFRLLPEWIPRLEPLLRGIMPQEQTLVHASQQRH